MCFQSYKITHNHMVGRTLLFKQAAFAFDFVRNVFVFLQIETRRCELHKI